MTGFLRNVILLLASALPFAAKGQFNTDRLLTIGRSALYYEDYVLSIQYFNQAIGSKPYLYEPWFYRGVAKYYLDDFAGAEADCSEALKRNPYVVNVYELRGLTRIRQKEYAGAIADYSQALKYDPENRNFWTNRVLCRIELKDYADALADIDTMLVRWRDNAVCHVMRADVYLQQGDTARAEASLHRSTELDPYATQAWAALSVISLSRGKWRDAEKYLDKAIHLQPKQAGYYINRAMARVNQNNLRGAMDDYDTAIDHDPNNFLGHYNRGLLRAQVGDDNRAITDFDFVLRLEPDNLMALFNRALLLDKTGDVRGAIRDYSKVIAEFPNFWVGLHHRAACYRRLGMNKQAEADEFRIYKARLYKSLYGAQPRLNRKQMRKRSDLDLSKYNQLVVADEQETERKYESDYRGRVQDHKADMTLLPMFELSYEPHASEVRSFVAYDRLVEAYNQNASGVHRRLYVNCGQATLSEPQSRIYFSLIDSLSAAMGVTDGQAASCEQMFGRAVAYSVIQNFESAREDLSACLLSDSTSALAYWQRAVCQSKMNAFNASLGTDVAMQTANVLSDLCSAIELSPQSPYLYYNRGNVYAARKDYAHAIEDYTAALKLDATLAEAYYNRGLVHILAKDIKAGTADLSKAGELGIYTAYSVIKRYSKEPQ